MASSHYKKSNSIHNHTSNKSEEAVKKFASMMIERMTALKNENWEKGWFNGVAYEGLPQNYSGRTYNASNSFMLQMLSSIENYSMPVFMTFKQAMDNGLRINKGAESFPVVYWDVNIKDANGKRIEFDDYKKLTKEERANYQVTPFLKYHPVFNVDQTNLKDVKPEKYEALREKYSIPEIKDDHGMYTHKAIDKMISDQSWLCPINADKITPKAFYSPSRDIIVHPTKAQFKIHSEQEEIYKDGMEYYSNMLHEIAHSTGHPDRLNREGGKFGDPKYAKEELVAELTAAMISNSMGFDSRITDNSAKYLDNWLTGLKEDPKFIVSVMADVNKAAEMILDKVDEQRLALGETPYLSKNMVTVENGYSLEPEFKPAQELIASEPVHSYYGSLKPEEKEQLNHSLVEQYNRMKEKHPDAVLLFRVEDNYMLFKEDTKIGKEILGLEISERNVPGIGILQYSEFKHSDLDKQLPKLPRAGVRVAICEQAFDPKLERPKISRGISNEIPKEKSYKELSEREQQKKERELIKDFSKDNTIAIINSYQKKYEPKERQFLEGDLPVSHSLLFQGLINFHQFYAASSPKEYAKFCLSNDLEPDYASAKQLWRNNHESGQPNVYIFPSSGEILQQREQKVDKHNDQELKILAVEEICLNIKNPTPFLNDLEKKGLITGQERIKVDELLNHPIMGENKIVAQQINPLKDLSIERLNELPVGTQITVKDLTSNYDVEIKTKQENGLWETAVGNGKGYTVIPDMEPKAIMGNFERMASAEKEWNSKLTYILSAPSLKQDLNDNLKNDNTMAKIKKSDESVSEKKHKKKTDKKTQDVNKDQKIENISKMDINAKEAKAEIFSINQGEKKGYEKDMFLTLKYDIGQGERFFEMKMDPQDYQNWKDNKISDKNLAGIYFEKLQSKYNLEYLETHLDPRFSSQKIHRTEQMPLHLSHLSLAEKGNPEETLKKQREPQMVTVNGDKVSHAHVFTKKDNPEQWLFIAKINDKYLPSVPITQQEADNYRVNKNVPEMMEKYYPTKVMPKISDEEFKAGQKIRRNNEELNIEKFNVYKESKPERENYGKYMFYAKVEGQSMSVLAKQEDLNAYFDKVKTPAQLVEGMFGEKLRLKSHYEQFKLPEGFNEKEVKLVKGKDSNQWMVYLNMGEQGNTKGKPISYDDKEAYFTNKTATLPQLGAKYLQSEINARMGMKQENKIAETQKMKI